jgi:uncharacterized protein
MTTDRRGGIRGLLGRPVELMLVGMIRGYQLVISPVLGPRCRFYPSCSRYAVGAIQTHGPITGVVLGSWRILRCHPWNDGGIDLVPSRGGVRDYLAHGNPPERGTNPEGHVDCSGHTDRPGSHRPLASSSITSSTAR